MILRWQEVAVPLSAVLALIVLKHVPMMADLPLARTAGVICFSYAIFLALRLVQGVEALDRDGWHELRASPVEVFGVYGAGAISALLLYSVFKNGQAGAVPASQLAATMAFSLLFALIALAVALISLLVKVRWNRTVIERTDAFGRRTILPWAEVAGVKSHWRGITIWTRESGSVSFSPYHSGAAQLAAFASQKIRRNASSAARAFAS